MNIIGTGLNGLVGSRIAELLPKYSFQNISRTTGIDLADFDQVHKAIASSVAPLVIHMAAYTNVDGAEEQKDLGEESEAWKINVIGTENVVKAAEETGKKLMYISTDFVFDGENTPENGYTEEDIPHPINWYAKTKYEGELRVQEAKIPWTIVRIAYPYRARFEKNDFFRAIKERFSQNLQIMGVTDHIFCPTFIDDIAFVVDTLISKNATGIYHATGAQAITPYDAALQIAEIFGFNEQLLQKTTREEYFRNKALRPFNLSMNNDKIEKLGVRMKGFDDGLAQIKRQMTNS